MVNIASWNVCLGLKRKKEYVKSMIIRENIDICCIQECEIKPDFPDNILTFRNFNLEVETNLVKSRCCIYIRDSISYIRRKDLEGKDNNLVIITVNLESLKYLIINVYRSFSTQGGVPPDVRFATQVGIINKTIKDNPELIPMVVGDFNLNYKLINNTQYHLKNIFDRLNATMDECNMLQIVNFPTWSRVINGIKKESIIDHIYIKDITNVLNFYPVSPEIGDHKIIIVKVDGSLPKPTFMIKRNWKKYCPELLTSKLAACNFVYNTTNVQQFWNKLENEIINVVDVLAPLTEFTNNHTTNSSVNSQVRPLIQKKRRLLKILKLTKDMSVGLRIKALNVEIVAKTKGIKRSNVRRCLIPGNSKSLWNAVNLAKDLNPSSIPSNMNLGGLEIKENDLSDAFVEFFDIKVKNIAISCKVDDNVYNGRRKIYSEPENFINQINVMNALRSIKIKNSEGYDRIPQRILNEGRELLIKPITRLFELIYESNQIPEQWSISKVIPIFKKGSKTLIENYRPIANLCSITKVYEQLIIDRLREIEKINNVDITGNPQHGFKQKRSTCTAGLTIQSVLSHALDNDNYSLMASIDLSAAFDVVNIDLLLKRLKIIGIPIDVINLIRIWLKNRLFYVDINGKTSWIKSSDSGTIQGSRLGPILYAIYVSPLFDLEKMTNYADDNFIIKSNKVLSRLIIDMEKSLEAITKWLKKSGLKVNEDKTEICLFHRHIQVNCDVNVNGIILHSKTSMNVLGVMFDSRLNWADHVSNAIRKTNRALYCIKQIKAYFTPPELNQLITTNVYSILYYNSEIWNIPTLCRVQKQLLLSASANALKVCTPSYHDRMSYLDLHSLNNRATPEMMCIYKHAILLYKLINHEIPFSDWIDLNFQQTFGARSDKFNFFRTNNYKVGCNNICNRLFVLNNKIKYNIMYGSFDSYKFRCKEIFL